MKIYVENIDKNINTTWRPIYEVIDAPFFEKTNIFPQYFLDLCKNNPNQPQFLPYDVKKRLENNVYGTSVICKSGHDPSKVFV